MEKLYSSLLAGKFTLNIKLLGHYMSIVTISSSRKGFKFTDYLNSNNGETCLVRGIDNDALR